jgi:hypothetical protein
MAKTTSAEDTMLRECGVGTNLSVLEHQLLVLAEFIPKLGHLHTNPPLYREH